MTGVPRGFFVYTQTHVNTCVIRENAVVGESHIFLLPLFVERAPAAFQQDALAEVIKTRERYLMEKFPLLRNPATKRSQNTASVLLRVPSGQYGM